MIANDAVTESEPGMIKRLFYLSEAEGGDGGEGNLFIWKILVSARSPVRAIGSIEICPARRKQPRAADRARRV